MRLARKVDVVGELPLPHLTELPVKRLKPMPQMLKVEFAI